MVLIAKVVGHQWLQDKDSAPGDPPDYSVYTCQDTGTSTFTVITNPLESPGEVTDEILRFDDCAILSPEDAAPLVGLVFTAFCASRSEV